MIIERHEVMDNDVWELTAPSSLDIDMMYEWYKHTYPDIVE